jgi:hypothetical protein
MNNKQQKHNLLSDILNRLNQYEQGIINHKKSGSMKILVVGLIKTSFQYSF